MLPLAALLVLWAALQLARPRLDPLLARLSTPSTRVALSPSALDLSTTALNGVPGAVLRWVPRTGTGRQSAGGRLRGWWDAGTLVVLVGCVVAQGVLVVAGARAVGALVGVLGGGSLEGRAAARLVRRAVGDGAVSAPAGTTGASSAADALLLRPLVPGLTTPLSLVPTLVAALVVAQGFHELGHALAAACERIPLLSLHVRLFLLVLPTFAVSLPSTSASASPSPSTDLRVAAAGIWHNVVLALGALVVSDQGGALGRRAGTVLGVWEQMSEGVLVVSVTSTSPLALHLGPGSTITHLDDLELDAVAHGVASALELWHQELEPLRAARPADPYERLGWCVPAGRGSAWRPVPSGHEHGDEACCAPTGPDDDDDEAAAPRVCFTARAPPPSSAGAPLQACLDPLALVPPAAEPAPRCVDDESCAAGGSVGAGAAAAQSVCARISERERVLRIGVVDDVVDAAPRTVLYQGERGAVLRQVTVTDLAPRHWFVSRSLPLTLETFSSALLSLSLALAFFNALPLPHLDGAHLVPALLSALAGGDEGLPRLAPGRGGYDAAEGERGALERVLRWAGRARAARWAVERREGLERGVRRWTVGVGGVTLGASVLVELLSWSAGR